MNRNGDPDLRVVPPPPVAGDVAENTGGNVLFSQKKQDVIFRHSRIVQQSFQHPFILLIGQKTNQRSMGAPGQSDQLSKRQPMHTPDNDPFGVSTDQGGRPWILGDMYQGEPRQCSQHVERRAKLQSWKTSDPFAYSVSLEVLLALKDALDNRQRTVWIPQNFKRLELVELACSDKLLELLGPHLPDRFHMPMVPHRTARPRPSFGGSRCQKSSPASLTGLPAATSDMPARRFSRRHRRQRVPSRLHLVQTTALTDASAIPRRKSMDMRARAQGCPKAPGCFSGVP